MRHAELYRPKRSRYRNKAEKLEAHRQRVLDAEAEAQRILVISHGHCLDGVGSVIVTLRALGTDGVGVAYVQPSDMTRVLGWLRDTPGRGRRLLIADLSLDPDDFDEIVEDCRRLTRNGWTVEWRDHHHKQWEGLDLDRLRAHVEALEVNDDATESGASLMQKALAPKDGFAKRFADTVKDRDLWKNETPDSETLEFAITWMDTEDFTAHFLPKGGDDPVVDETIRHAADMQRQLIEDHTEILLDDARYAETPDGDRVAVVYGWLPKNVGLHRMLQQEAVQVAINVRPNGKMSLRSREDSPVCHLIARRFGGGGHPNASGGDLGLEGLAEKWYVWRKGKVAKTQEVLQAAVEILHDHGDGEQA